MYGAIKRIGGALPEQIPPAEPIKEVKKRLKKATPTLELDEREAGGLLGERPKNAGSAKRDVEPLGDEKPLKLDWMPVAGGGQSPPHSQPGNGTIIEIRLK